MMDWLLVVAAGGGVTWLVGWRLPRMFRDALEVEVNADAVSKAHAAELAARREALACLQSLIRQRQANVCLWEALGEYSQMLADAMGVAEEFGASEGMAFLAGEMGGERWGRIIEWTDKAKS